MDCDLCLASPIVMNLLRNRAKFLVSSGIGSIVCASRAL